MHSNRLVSANSIYVYNRRVSSRGGQVKTHALAAGAVIDALAVGAVIDALAARADALAAGAVIDALAAGADALAAGAARALDRGENCKTSSALGAIGAISALGTTWLQPRHDIGIELTKLLLM
ncbi:hypothetical protein K504DRAFT_446058 [Pleomassaria siparia CBS 279.74]|uniref:Uncharacterized protein n=1 Tax=Pleomassaria siparia CBS 279.74 TaxID=1314801 RepID=A0A6G1KRI6_9PLEO|nr:hypothetical protein K504DRAFT_446058 [Pleomassaria siparia CBS 279.74]